MNIKHTTRKWHSASMDKSWERLCKHAMNHYPKDAKLAKCIREAMKLSDNAAMKWGKTCARPTARKTTAKRSPAKRRTAARRTTRKTAARRATPRTTRRAAPKRRATRRRSA